MTTTSVRTSVPLIRGRVDLLEPETFMPPKSSVPIMLYLQDGGGVIAEMVLEVGSIQPFTSEFGNARTRVEFVTPVTVKAFHAGTVIRGTLVIPGRDPIDVPAGSRLTLTTYHVHANQEVTLTDAVANLLGEWHGPA